MIGSGKDGSDNFAHEDNEGCSRAPPQTRKEAKRLEHPFILEKEAERFVRKLDVGEGEND